MHPFFMYNHQVPRYTSYPTANHFSKDITEGEYRQWLGMTQKGDDISLYIHIPYCKKLCWYCGCHVQITQKYDPIQKYLAYLKKEIRMVSHAMYGQGTVSHIHFGGGSPTILEPKDFHDLMHFIHNHFILSEDANIDIEIDPRGITPEKIKAYADSSVTRASLGVQDFHDNVQEAIGRSQSYSTIFNTVKLLRDHDITNINFDLIYGLPHQTERIMLENLDYATMFHPSRIALFGYAHVPWMKKHMRMIDEKTLPNDEARFKMFQTSSRYLSEKGYMAIGLDHFVKNSDDLAVAYKNKTLKRNFQGYSTDRAPIMIGLGVSSIGKTKRGYIQNEPSTRDYYNALDSYMLPVQRGIASTDMDVMTHHIIENLMCYFEVDLKKIAQKFSVPLSYFETICKKIKIMEQHNLVMLNDYHITISQESRQIVRIICSYFDPYFKPSTQQHSVAS